MARISLTKAQVQAGLGAELLVLCQSVTEDGSLSKDEIVALGTWLRANRSSELPALRFLITTLERIIADKKVTKQERAELYKAIETVLPPEARQQAVQHRRGVEAEDKAITKSEREATKQQEREERERKRPILSANFLVAGIHFEGRPRIIRRYVADGDQVFLARDRHNQFSRNAVEVRLRNGLQIGYVPEVNPSLWAAAGAPDVAPLLDQGCSHLAYITKILEGGRVPIPVVQAYVYRPDAIVEGAVFQADVPTKRIPATRKRPGCLGVILLGLLLISGLVGLLALLR